MKNDRNKNTLQLLARKSYIHPYIFPYICPAEFVRLCVLQSVGRHSICDCLLVKLRQIGPFPHRWSYIYTYYGKM